VLSRYPTPLRPEENEEEEKEEEDMVKRFHGVDRHKKYRSISVLDREGVEIEFIGKCEDPRAYMGKLDSEGAVVTESGSGCFYWVDRIE
jgi:transposase